MTLGLESLWGVLPAFIAVIFGLFRQFYLPNQELRRRIRRAENNSLEDLAVKIASAINHSRKVEADGELRGDGVENPDLIKQVSEGVIIVLRRINVLDAAKLWAKRTNWGLLGIAISGLAFAAIANFNDSLMPYITTLGLGLSMVQVILILVRVHISNRLENVDDGDK